MSERAPSLWSRAAVIAVAGAIAGWAGFTVYEHRAPRSATPPSDDPRVAAFLDEGYGHLHAGRTDQAREAFTKASALAPDDGDVWEARLRADVQAADGAWRRWRFSAEGDEARRRALDVFDHAVDQARARIAEALRHPGLSSGTRTRLALEERRLNALLVAAFAEMGQHERAAGAFSARLEGEPEAVEVKPFVDRARDESDAGAEEDAGAPDAGDGPEEGHAGDAVPPPVAPRPDPFEFDHEPVHVPAAPGELEVPRDP